MDHTRLPPGTWTYGFLRNCADDQPNCTAGCLGEISDPANPPWNTSGSLEPTGQVCVPGDPAFGTPDMSWQAPDARHGTLVDVSYPDPQSINPAGPHPLAVYLPPRYDPKRRVPYPTLYLSHGAGGNEADWSTQGAAGNIIDNLIASGRVQPMVLVMTDFNGLPGGNDGYRTDVLNYVIPYVEAHYNVSHNGNDRAFAGLSAGGSRANNILFNAATEFGYYGVWSVGTGGAPAADSPLWQNPDLTTRLAILTDGGLYDTATVPGTNTYLALLASHGIPAGSEFVLGAHTWYVWRQLLHDFASTLAFRHSTPTASAPATTVRGRPARFTASVASDTSEPARPAGTVSFYLDSVIDPAHLLGTVPLPPSGPARLTVPRPAIGVGEHTVTAVYGGSNLYNASTSDPVSFTVVA